jgi:tetratricopeptide (TPR) repeat protein
VIEGYAPGAAKAEKVRHTRRSRSRRQEVRQVNEYAFWCLEKGLWNEARLHLEQAVERDSLAASLHNNLGIIYERMGLEEKALTAYGKAWDLSPREKAYRDNLEKLKRRQRAIPDSAVRIDIIELDDQAEQGPASGSPAEARQSILAGG